MGLGKHKATSVEDIQENIPEMSIPNGKIEIVGEMEKTIFKSGGGYGIYSIKTDTGHTIFTTNADIDITEGEIVSLQGQWTNNAKYGKQFKADMVNIELPKDRSGIINWLANENFIHGVGARTAQKLGDHFGNTIKDVVGNADILRESGIPKNKAEKIASEWNRQTQRNKVTIWLHSLFIPPNQVDAILKHYGKDVKEIIEHNPWGLMTEIDGMGFKTVDKVATALGKDSNSPERIIAGLGHSLDSACGRMGHCGLPEAELLNESEKTLSLSKGEISKYLGNLISKDEYTKDEISELYAPIRLHQSEFAIVNKMKTMIKNAEQAMSKEDAESLLESVMGDIKLGDEQYDAAVSILVNPISILTGGPGTGKSTIQRIIVDALKAKRKRINLVAPTGRASKRLEDVSGHEASTVHKLLFARTEADDVEEFEEFDENGQLLADWIIIDEFSMMDTNLTASLFNKMNDKSGATIVGDVDQLPSVGAGQVLKDLIDSEIIPVSKLTKIWRQEDGSDIITASHRINNGEYPAGKTENLNGFSILEKSDPSDVSDSVVRLLTKTLPKRGIDPFVDVQIMASMKKGEVGVWEMNKVVKNVLNPVVPGDGNTSFLDGNAFTVRDRVMQLRNDYNKGVFNGEIGSVVETGLDYDKKGNLETMIKVRFDDKIAKYSAGDINDLQQAWASTVHKSQGCEFPVVVFICPEDHWYMLSRNLFYTAVTRAKEDCVVIGTKKAITRAVTNVDIKNRHTGLLVNLQDKIKPYEVGVDKKSDQGWTYQEPLAL